MPAASAPQVARAPQSPVDPMVASIAYAKPPGTPEADDPVPPDIHVFRLAMVRRISNFLGSWRSCREPVCRRHRRCVGRKLRCSRDNRVKMTAEERSRFSAQVQHAIKRELARRAG